MAKRKTLGFLGGSILGLAGGLAITFGFFSKLYQPNEGYLETVRQNSKAITEVVPDTVVVGKDTIISNKSDTIFYLVPAKFFTKSMHKFRN